MAVRDALVRGQQAADQAYLATYHRTGRLIHGHLLAQQARAGYGARLVPRLAAALQTDERLLYRCLRFFRAYPKLASRPELAWTHYRVLLDVTDQADLFTYRAGVIRVVDGDTLWVRVDLEPGRWVKQKLRLRDLDCPELSTPAGKAAKRFTEGFVAGAAALTICTTKPDKYDRYLADVFVDRAGGGEAYLNNALLESGHAVVKRDWEFADWGE